MIWGSLLHLSYNMWGDNGTPRGTIADRWGPYSEQIQCDRLLWREFTDKMAQGGLNMVLIDVGDAVRFESHPEISVRGAWTPEELNTEVVRLRGLGIQAVPKLNFAASHDAWLGEYARMISTAPYYRVCSDLISETIDIFDSPPLFHLGMDEETAGHQKTYDHVVVRQGDLWWHDLQFLVNQVESHDVRPWVWSDHAWRDRDNYLNRMPRSVLQSNWYYAPAVGEPDFAGMEHRIAMLKAFVDLEEHGFDQVPCGSTWDSPENFPRLVTHCSDLISPDRLHGFLMTTWLPCVEEFRAHHRSAIEIVANTRQAADRRIRL